MSFCVFGALLYCSLVDVVVCWMCSITSVRRRWKNNHDGWWRLITIVLSKNAYGVRSKYLTTIIWMVHQGKKNLIVAMSLVKIKRVFFLNSVSLISNIQYKYTQWSDFHFDQYCSRGTNKWINKKKTNREKHGKVKHKDVATRINLLRISDRFGAIRVIFRWKAPNKNV